MSLADLLRAKRETKGWTEEYIAEKTGVSTISVSGWENGILPQKKNLKKIVEAYELTRKEFSREYMNDLLEERENEENDQQTPFPSMLFLDADAHYLQNLSFTEREVNLIRTICVAQKNGAYTDWTLGTQYSYDPSVLQSVFPGSNITISALNELAHGLWLKLNDKNHHEPHKDVIRFIMQYLMEDPVGIENSSFSITDFDSDRMLWLAWVLLYTADRTCQYDIAWIPEFEHIVQIVQLIEQNKFNAIEFIENNHLIYNKTVLKADSWLFSGKEINEWVCFGRKDPEPGLSEETKQIPQLTTKGKALVTYIKQNKELFQKFNRKG